MSISLARTFRGVATTAAVLSVFVLAIAARPAEAASGGLAAGEPKTQHKGTVGHARLLPNGKAVAPANAPKRVVAVIKAANRIRTKPYVWGGGHGRWRDRGYDCSGAVSFALHGGRMLSSPLASGSLMRWGKGGRGRWITVFANGGHAYARIAGLRWDTSGTGGKGPRWQKDPRSGRGYVKRHPRGF